MEEQSIAEMKVKTTDMCIHCNQDLKTTKLGGSGNLFDFTSTGTGAYYCDNLKCEFYGYLTLGKKTKTEKVVELKDEVTPPK